MTNTIKKTAIGQAIFYVESVAHLQGKERELLPIVESARAELAEIKAALVKADAVIEYLTPANPTADVSRLSLDARKLVQASLAKIG